MRNTYSNILLIAIAMICMSGCRNAETREILRGMMGSTIVLPEKITCVQNGEVFPIPDSLRTGPLLIIYVDSAECNTCRISHLWEYDELFRISEETASFDLIFMMGNTSFESIPLVRYLSDQDIGHPIYVDEENIFLSSNPFIPQDAKYHSFLINDRGNPIFVGDPTLSSQMLEVFKCSLSEL